MCPCYAKRRRGSILEMDIAKLAELARLRLSPEEADRMAGQLAHILRYVEQVQSVDTAGVTTTSHPLAADTTWRDDLPAASLDRDAALANAPDARRDEGLFRVPKVIGG